jgi:ABC-type multidrug transport system ATPase subunit
MADHVGIIEHGKMFVSGSLDDLKESVKRVRFGLRGATPKLPFPGALKTRQTDGDLIVTMRNPDVRAIRDFAHTHNADFEIIDLNLEELFTEFVG